MVLKSKSFSDEKCTILYKIVIYDIRKKTDLETQDNLQKENIEAEIPFSNTLIEVHGYAYAKKIHTYNVEDNQSDFL